MVDFSEYAAVLLRMLNHCIKEPHSHLAVFVMQRDGSARLDFIQVKRSPRRPSQEAPLSLPICLAAAHDGPWVRARRTWSTSSWSCCRASSRRARKSW